MKRTAFSLFFTILFFLFLFSEAGGSTSALVKMRKVDLSAFETFQGLLDIVVIPDTASSDPIANPKVLILIKAEYVAPAPKIKRPDAGKPSGGGNPIGVFPAWLKGASIVPGTTPIIALLDGGDIELSAVWLNGGGTARSAAGKGLIFESETTGSDVSFYSIPFDRNGTPGTSNKLFTMKPPNPHSQGNSVMSYLRRDSVALTSQNGSTVSAAVGVNWRETSSSVSPQGSAGPHSYSLFFSSFNGSGLPLNPTAPGVIKKKDYAWIQLWTPAFQWPYWAASVVQYKILDTYYYPVQNDLWYYTFTSGSSRPAANPDLFKKRKIASSKESLSDLYNYAQTLERSDGKEPDSLIYQYRDYSYMGNPLYYYSGRYFRQPVSQGDKVGSPVEIDVPYWYPIIMKPRTSDYLRHFSEQLSNLVLVAPDVYYGVMTRSLVRVVSSSSSSADAALLKNTDTSAYVIRFDLKNSKAEFVANIGVKVKEGDYFDYPSVTLVENSLLVYVEKVNTNTYVREAYNGTYSPTD